MTARPAKLLSLLPKYQFLLIMAASLLMVFRIGLLLLPFSYMLGFMHRIGKHSRIPPRSSAMQKDRIVWSVKAICRHLDWASCLPQAMTAQALLVRYGHNTELRIGIRKNKPGPLKAHAWVANRDEILIGDTPDISEYKPFPPLKALGG